jgi:hypothetical protein
MNGPTSSARAHAVCVPKQHCLTLTRWRRLHSTGAMPCGEGGYNGKPCYRAAGEPLKRTYELLTGFEAFWHDACLI